MKKALLCVTALCLSVLLCSCWDYTELNLRHIATGLALDQGKDIFCVPSRIGDPIGCNLLIQQGAKLILDINDIIEE